MANLDERLSIYKIVGNTLENVLATEELVKNWIHIRWQAEWDFWEELFSAINSKIPFSFEKDYSPEQLNAAIHQKKNKNPWYGTHALIKTIKYNGKALEIYFALQRGFGNLNYGIWIYEAAELESKEHYYNFRLKRETNNFFAECETKLDDKYWSYKKEALTGVNFNSFEDEGTVKLINSQFRMAAINLLIDESNHFIQEFLKDEIIISSKIL